MGLWKEGMKVRVTDHAMRRYRQRLRGTGAEGFSALLRHLHEALRLPDWSWHGDRGDGTRFYRHESLGLVFVARVQDSKLVVVTVVKSA